MITDHIARATTRLAEALPAALTTVFGTPMPDAWIVEQEDAIVHLPGVGLSVLVEDDSLLPSATKSCLYAVYVAVPVPATRDSPEDVDLVDVGEAQNLGESIALLCTAVAMQRLERWWSAAATAEELAEATSITDALTVAFDVTEDG